MIARVPGFFGHKGRPVILDVSQLIRRVLWGKTDLYAVVMYQWTFSGTSPTDYPIFLRTLPFGSSWNLNTAVTQLIPLVDPTPVVESKISNEQRARMLLWTYEPNRTTTSETSTITTTVITLAHWVGYIGGGHPIFGGNFETAEQAYAAFVPSFIDLIGRPPDPLNPNDMYVGVTDILESHEETTTVTRHRKTLAGMLFLNLALIAQKHLPTPTPTTNPKLKFEISLGSAIASQGVSWNVELLTFKGSRTYPPNRSLGGPSDAQFAKMEMTGEWPAAVAGPAGFDKIGGGDFPPMAARVLTFEIDCVTLAITQSTLAPP